MKSISFEIYDDAVPEMIAAQRDLNLFLLTKAENLLHDREDSKAVLLLKQVIQNIESLKKQIPGLVAATPPQKSHLKNTANPADLLREANPPIQAIVELAMDTAEVIEAAKEKEPAVAVSLFAEEAPKKRRGRGKAKPKGDVTNGNAL